MAIVRDRRAATSIQRTIGRAVVIVGCLILAACQSDLDLLGGGEDTAMVAGPPQDQTPVSPEAATADLYGEGVQQFRAGAFQVAEVCFRTVLARSPEDLPALMGLAASYDRLGLYERADEAYAEAIRIGGVTAQILNNQGYSRLLRGDIDGAREKFLAAHQLNPEHDAIKNNLVLLAASSHMLEAGLSARD